MTIPASRYLIDSSILIPYIRQNQSIVARLNALSNAYISPTIIAEIAYGALRSRNPSHGMQQVNNIVSQMPTVGINQGIGFAFATIKNNLVMRNQLIPDSDIWIAVTAIAYGMTLVARDAHFTRVVPYGLTFTQW
ncbi:MAG TPA: type II toxin-antitoxin system VapC family toxin [Ktedonobacterales bacterium]|nr:type II toxin-antitoxin system VapC family toxin [Ktedonobacterales bacterium]